MFRHRKRCSPHFVRFGAISAALFASWPATAQVVCPDLNGDCTIDGGDMGIMLAQWGSCSSPCSADLNGDMEVDGGDQGLLLAQWDATCGPYEMHWNVTGTKEGDITLDSGIAAVMQDDVKILYEQFYGVFPDDGLHETFGTGGDYSDWENFHSGFLAGHVADMEAYVASLGLPSNYSGYMIIDYESWRPVWENVSAGRQNDWEDFIEDINSPTWDTTFNSIIGYTPPLGVTGYPGLTAPRKEAYAKLSWDHFAKEFYLLSLTTGQGELTSAKWGFYGFPQRHYWDSGSIGYPQWQRDLNDEMDWLWAAVDVITPSIYQIYEAVTGTPSGYEISTENNVVYILENIQEAVRVRDLYASSGVKVFAYVHPYYTSDPANPAFNTPCSPINVDHMIRMPRYAGADGLFLWGWVMCDSTCNLCSSEAACVDSWEDQLNDIWEPVVLDMETDCQ